MNILLVGHEGYVGSALYELLKKQGHLVKGWGSRDNLFSLEAKRLRELRCEAVVNCAAAFDRKGERFVGGSPSDWVNVEGVRHLVECLQGSETRLIQLSTKDVYGPVYGPNDILVEEDRYLPRALIDDEHAFKPRTAYGKSKLMGEFLTEGHPWSTVLRLSTIYTDEPHRNMGWIGSMARAYLSDETLKVTGNGKQFRDALHVEDLADLIGRLLGVPRDSAAGLKMNAGGGPENTFSLLQYLKWLGEGGEPPKVEFTAMEDLGFAFSNRVARERFGWSPRVKLKDRLPVLKQKIAAKLTAGAPQP